jgi:hypothetical protein
MSLILKSLDTLMVSTYERLKKGLYFDPNLKPYRQDFVQKVLDYFEEKERYEECVVIREIIKNRFNHENERSFRNF